MPRLNMCSYPTMSHITIDASGIENLSTKLNPHKSLGPDAIPAHHLRELSAEVAPALSIVIQMSLDTGQISDDWRMSYIAPVYKRGDKFSAENNRPMSMTSICSIVIEHILLSNIIQH